MIKNPSYWRRDIIKTTEKLDRRRHQNRWNEISFSHTEKSIMIALYVIRKILEARKASPKVLTASVRIMEYPRRPNMKSKVIAPLLQGYFDLDHPKKCDRKLLFICHQVVHSYIFSVAVGYSSGFEGIYFSSDRFRNKCLFFIPAKTIIKIFRMVGTDPDAEFSPWVEERLPFHRVQTAFPQPELGITKALSRAH